MLLKNWAPGAYYKISKNPNFEGPFSGPEGHENIFFGRYTQRGPAEDIGGPAEGGRRRSPEVGFSNLQSSPASWPQTFLQNTLGDLNSPAHLRHS